MKKIELTISDEVYRELSHAISLKYMIGSTYGILDEFIINLIKAFKDGKEELKLSHNSEKKRG